MPIHLSTLQSHISVQENWVVEIKNNEHSNLLNLAYLCLEITLLSCTYLTCHVSPEVPHNPHIFDRFFCYNKHKTF